MKWGEHLHVKTHLKAALHLLISFLPHYETKTFELLQIYTSVIASLFSQPSSLAKAQVWDIFAHVLYTSHPIPDVVIYTLMISTCASLIMTRYSSEPEKALDLWTGMTVCEWGFQASKANAALQIVTDLDTCHPWPDTSRETFCATGRGKEDRRSR